MLKIKQFYIPVNILKIPEFAEVNPFADKVAISSDIESNFQI